MTTQVEHLDNHTARLTVQVEQAEVEKAMQQAAKKIGNNVNIPGFRKGKAPYSVILRYFGPQAVLQEAIDPLSQTVYRKALEETGIEPYSMGSLEDVQTEPTVSMVFIVQKAPEIELNAYRDIRVPYESAVVEEAEVDKFIERIRNAKAANEVVDREAQLGDKVKFHIHADIVHDHGDAEEPEQAEDAQGTAEENTDEQAESEERSLEEYIDTDFDEVLVDDPSEDFVPGFAHQLVGMKVGESKSFTVVLPENFREQRYANHPMDITVDILEVKSHTLPELTDDFAKEASEGEAETLDAMRNQIRQDMEARATSKVDDTYGNQVLELMTEQARITYPPAMFDNAMNEHLESLDQNLRRNGITLDQYKQIQQKTDEDLRQEFQELVDKRIKRSLVMSQISNVEEINVDGQDLQDRMTKMLDRFNDMVNDEKQQRNFRKMMLEPQNAEAIALDLLTEGTFKRIIAIGKGENPPLPEHKPEQAEETTVDNELAPHEATDLSTPPTDETPADGGR